MFCQKCGAQLPDGVRFCQKCGTEVNGESHSVVQDTPIDDMYQMVEINGGALESYELNKKMGISIAAIVLVFFVGLCVVKGVMKFYDKNNGYKECVEDYLISKGYSDEISSISYETTYIEGYDLAKEAITPFYDWYGDEQKRMTRAVYDERTGWEIYDCKITYTSHDPWGN
jgi:hypothetical protein